jgi:hypothetical protein
VEEVDELAVRDAAALVRVEVVHEKVHFLVAQVVVRDLPPVRDRSNSYFRGRVWVRVSAWRMRSRSERTRRIAPSARRRAERRPSGGGATTDNTRSVARRRGCFFHGRSGGMFDCFGGCCGDRLFWRGGTLFRRRSLVWQLALCLAVARRVWFLLFRRRSLVWQLALCLAVARRVRFLSAVASATSFDRVGRYVL